MRGSNDLLRALLHEAGLTQGSLVRAVNAVSRECGESLNYDRSAVAHWIAGTRPRDPVPQLIAEVLTRRLGRLVTPADIGFPTDPRVELLPHRDGLRADADLAALCQGSVAPETRAAFHRLPFRLALLTTHDPPAVPPPRRPAGSGGRGAGQRELSILRFYVQVGAEGLNLLGGAALQPAVTRWLSTEALTWLRTATSDTVRRDLQVESAKLAFLLARMYEDQRISGLAQRYFVQARHLAAGAGAPWLRAVSTRAMSAQALALGHRAAALAAAEEAVSVAERTVGINGDVRAYLTVQQALAQAARGRRRAALRSLDAAERAADGVGGDMVDADPFLVYPPAALDYQAARVHAALGELPAACQAMERAARRRAPQDIRGRALSLARAAELRLRRGHVEEACHLWHQFLDHCPQISSARVEEARRGMVTSLRPFRRVRAARDVLDRAAAQSAGRIPAPR